MNGKKRRKKNNESQREVERKSTKRGEVREEKCNIIYFRGYNGETNGSKIVNIALTTKIEKWRRRKNVR